MSNPSDHSSSATSGAEPGIAASRGEVLARIPEFTQLGASPLNGAGGAIDMLNDIPITLTATLGQTVMTIGDILKLGPGATVGLDREVSQPVDLTVGGKVFARGEVVVVNDRFAIRIKDLGATRPAAAGESQ
jgi:flagellar motor switch protein FliN/FliY